MPPLPPPSRSLASAGVKSSANWRSVLGAAGCDMSFGGLRGGGRSADFIQRKQLVGDLPALFPTPRRYDGVLCECHSMSKVDVRSHAEAVNPTFRLVRKALRRDVVPLNLDVGVHEPVEAHRPIVEDRADAGVQQIRVAVARPDLPGSKSVIAAVAVAFF